MLSSVSDKGNLFAEHFPKKSNLVDSGMYLPALISRTDLTLDKILLIPKLVKKFITNLDSFKTGGPDCIPVDFFSDF